MNSVRTDNLSLKYTYEKLIDKDNGEMQTKCKIIAKYCNILVKNQQLLTKAIDVFSFFNMNPIQLSFVFYNL